MKKLKKKLSLMLALLMFALMIVSCNKSNPVDTNIDKTKTVDVTETKTEQTTHKVPDTLDYNGEVFNIAYPKAWAYDIGYFADEMTGDVLNDAVYERVSRVEEYLNVDIRQKECGVWNEIIPNITPAVLAGDDAYQLVLTHCFSGVGSFMTGGFLYNYDNLTYVDTSAKWWHQEQMNQLRLGKNTYYGVSDYMLPDPYVIYYNKDIVSNYKFDNPYQLVYDGKWTLDTYISMTETVVGDVDGDGVIGKNDRLGSTTSEWSKLISFMTGSNQFLTKKDENGIPRLAIYTDKMTSIIEKMFALSSVNGAIYLPDSNNRVNSKSNEMMADGNILFLLEGLSGAYACRDFDFDVGILPYPKYDEAQDNYISLEWGGLMGVPASIRNPDMVGAVIELLAYTSSDTVIPAYYDVTLKGKLARDKDTVTMLDIIFNTTTFEVGGNYFHQLNGFGNLFYSLPDMILVLKSTDFSSYYKRTEESANAAIEKFYNDLEISENK